MICAKIIICIWMISIYLDLHKHISFSDMLPYTPSRRVWANIENFWNESIYILTNIFFSWISEWCFHFQIKVYRMQKPNLHEVNKFFVPIHSPSCHPFPEISMPQSSVLYSRCRVIVLTWRFCRFRVSIVNVYSWLNLL